MTGTVFVEAPARLHFGVLDLRGSLGRWFGGVGAAAPEPTLLVSASPAAQLEVTGEDATRAAEFARQFLDYHGVSGGASICVHRALPRHSGLGSGTQLALAVARSLAVLHNLDADAQALATATGRARRSAIGTWTFAGGGLVLEGGHPRDVQGVAPLLARLPFPASWRCIVAVPAGPSGISGDEEAAAFSRLPAPSERDVEKVAHLVLMALLPSVVEADLVRFGSALTQIQQITGGWFERVQGGTFTPGASADLIRAMKEWGVPGVGQSSWGPAVYGIVEGPDAAARLAARLRQTVDPGGQVFEGPFRTEGARVWLGSK
jgi:beta-RFAP synthase